MKKVKGGVCAPLGFLASGIFSGVKRSGRKDLALIFSEDEATLASVFTTSKVPAAPVIVSKKNAKGGVAQAIIANAGNANCATGAQGLKDAKRMVSETAEVLGIAEKLVLVTSTGSIGKPLKMEKIIPGIKKCERLLSRRGGSAAAEAILTTDKVRKEIAYEVKVGDKTFRVGGNAKGSGMIHPNMATMHSFITTDVKISRATMQKMLKDAVDDSFNMITVDREMSTNDCVFALANGMSKVSVGGFMNGEATKLFAEALRAVCLYLAKEIARDGEGATKLIEINLKGAKSKQDARAAARQVAGSDLVMAAFFGRDPNFGRILASLGAAGISLDPNKIDLKMQGIPLVKNGVGLPKNMTKAAKKLKSKEILVEIDLNIGGQTATAYGCDLTYSYVKINAKYHT